MMNIKLIKTEADYQNALKRLEEIFDTKIGTLESNEADIPGLMKPYTWTLNPRLQSQKS